MNSTHPTNVPLRADLSASALLRLSFSEPVTLDIEAGAVWVTTTQCDQDILRFTGESLNLTADESAIVSALGSATVRISSRQTAPKHSIMMSAWRRWRGRQKPSNCPPAILAA